MSTCNICEAVNEARHKTEGSPYLPEARKVIVDLGFLLVTVCEDIMPLALRLTKAKQGSNLDAEFGVLADLDEALHLNKYSAE